MYCASCRPLIAAMRRLSKIDDHATHAVFDGVDQDLRVHHERTITAEGNAIARLLRQSRREQRTRRKAHIGRAGFGESIASAVVLHNLEAVGLHIAGIKKFRSTDFFGEIGDDLDRRRLRQDRLLPGFVT